MTVDAASVACCCGGLGPGGIPCAQFLACAPPTLTLSWSVSQSLSRRYPAGGQYTDYFASTAVGTMTRNQSGVYVGTLVCNAAQHREVEAVAGSFHFEGSGPCDGNPWGCPNLDCCATLLDSTTDTTWDEFLLDVTLSCYDANGQLPGGLNLVISDGGRTTTQRDTTMLRCPIDGIPNPLVETQDVPACGVPLRTNSESLCGLYGIEAACDISGWGAQFNFDTTTTTTATQTSDLACFRFLDVPPFYELVGSCASGPSEPLVCGDIVTVERRVQAVSIG